MMDMIEKMTGFVKKHIADTNLNTDAFPDDIWGAMKAEGLLDICSSYYEIGMAGRQLVLEGGNIGIALSWMLHQLAGRFVFERLGNDFQKQMLFSGKTACLAMSEPKTGAHPKFMTTKAERVADGYIINGEKAYITNAPIADMAVVIAITSEDEGHKQFSAFIIPKDTPGMTISDMKIAFVKPSPHGTIKLEGCRVPHGALIGMPGRAYEQIVHPFREVEDACMMGIMSGAMSFILSNLKPNIDLMEETKLAVGRMKAISDSVYILARQALIMLEEGNNQSLLSLILVLRSLGSEFFSMADKHAIHFRSEGPRLGMILKDAAAMIKIAGNVARIKQIKLGESILNLK
jgi:acyl-CoA dehydrogenase